MVFDPTKYQNFEIKSLPVILLLDTSGSMSYDGKIQALQKAVEKMVDAFIAEQIKETMIKVAIITFGATIGYREYKDIKELQAEGLEQLPAVGGTPLGTALSCAKDLIEDPQVTLKKWYTPIVVLVSDGEPNDAGWEMRMNNFINDGKSAKCQKIAVAIGEDADKEMLAKFTGDEALVFYAQNAEDIVKQFEKVSRSISMIAKGKKKSLTNGSRTTKTSQKPSLHPDEGEAEDDLGF